tara:strand:- start:699 stop:1115 length:417 start_codon:yes stop_codon:yes gene_type:complete
VLTKSVIISELNKQLLRKLTYLKTNLKQAIQSRNSDTKSSAGDKFETSREMAQIEIHKIEIEISKTQQFITDLFSKVTQLIITDKGVFLISIPFGKLILNDEKIFCISKNAPITKHLITTKKNNNFFYNDMKYNIIGG